MRVVNERTSERITMSPKRCLHISINQLLAGGVTQCCGSSKHGPAFKRPMIPTMPPSRWPYSAYTYQDQEHEMVVHEVPAAGGETEREPRSHAYRVQLQVVGRDRQPVKLETHPIALLNPLLEVLHCFESRH